MYSYETRIAPSQTGEDGLQTLASLIGLIQDCSQLWLESEPIMTDFLEDRGAAMIIASRQMDIIRFPAFRERVEVSTGVYGCKKFFGYRNTMVTGEDGQPCAIDRGVGVFIDRSTGKPVRLPEEVIASLTFDPQIELSSSDKKIHPEGEARQCPSIFARRSDIDHNKHVNNAYYVRMACDCLPEDQRYHNLRVEYRTPAVLGDEIVPLVRLSDDGIAFVELLNLQGKPYAVVELSHPFEP